MTVELYLYKNGGKIWSYNSTRHNIHGPSYVYPNGKLYWYVNDIECNSLLEYLVAVNEYNLIKKNND